MSRLSYRIFPGKNGGKDVKKSTISSHIFCKSPICVERCWDSAFQILSSNLQLRSQMENLLQPPNSPRLFWTRSLAVVKNLKLRWCFIRKKNSFNSWTSLVSWLVWTTVPELIGAKVPSVLFGGKIEMYWCIWFMRCIWMFNDVYIHTYIYMCVYTYPCICIYIYKCFSIRFTQHLPICCFPPKKKKLGRESIESLWLWRPEAMFPQKPMSFLSQDLFVVESCFRYVALPKTNIFPENRRTPKRK